MNNVKEKNRLLFFILLGFLVFFPFLGSVHLFDWDEANFAEIAREMILTKNYLQPQINYLPFYEKPPVFIWMQIASMKFFGINEFAARFPNACLGILVAITLVLIGRKERDWKFGFIWLMCYMGSFLPFMYFRTGLIDPWFNYFIFLSLYFYYLGVKSTKYKAQSILASAMFLGLAVQTKGPAAMIIVYGSLGAIWIVSRFKYYLGFWKSIAWFICSLIFSCIWFYVETKAHGDNYIKEFIIYQIRLFTTEDATHGGPFYYHFIVLLIGCFPASFILLFKNNWKENWRDDWFKILCICGLFVLILFSIVQTKIIHYSSMAYFPISYIAAVAIYASSFRNEKWLKHILSIIFFFLIIAMILLPIFGKNIDSILPYIQDTQARLQLGTKVDWDYWEILIGLLVLGIFLVLRYYFDNKLYPYFISTTILVLFMLLFFAPKIERYTQGTYIDFCKSKKGKDVYIQPLFLKSYATLFYSDRMPFQNDTSRNHGWMYDGDIDKDVFFISITKDSLLVSYPRPYIQILERKNGYDFMYRKLDSTKSY
jgi:4-amino-4-deoxy-L-arabinose transferase-like glycosyltransferase